MDLLYGYSFFLHWFLRTYIVCAPVGTTKEHLKVFCGVVHSFWSAVSLAAIIIDVRAEVPSC